MLLKILCHRQLYFYQILIVDMCKFPAKTDLPENPHFTHFRPDNVTASFCCYHNKMQRVYALLNPLALSISLPGPGRRNPSIIIIISHPFLPSVTTSFPQLTPTTPFSLPGLSCHLLFLDDISPGWTHNEVFSCQPKRIKEKKKMKKKNRRHHKLNFPHSSVYNLLVCLSLYHPVYIHSGRLVPSPFSYISCSPIPHSTDKSSAVVVKAAASTRSFILSPIGNSSGNSSGND